MNSKPAYQEKFEMIHCEIKLPMMSMSYGYTICKQCVKLYIVINKMDCNQKNVSVCDYPILDSSEKFMLSICKQCIELYIVMNKWIVIKECICL